MAERRPEFLRIGEQFWEDAWSKFCAFIIEFLEAMIGLFIMV